MPTLSDLARRIKTLEQEVAALKAHPLARILLVDGAGSGLDADLLDGQTSTYFAVASHTHDDRYYTETELQTEGAAEVHWENITHKPPQGYFFFHDDASDLVGYELMLETPAGGAEEDDYADVTAAGGEVQIAQYITTPSSGWGQSHIPAGTWQFSTYCYVSSTVAGASTLHFYILKRAGATETALFDFSGTVTGTTVTLQEFESSQAEFTLAETDRLVVRIKAATARTPSTRVHFVHEGTAHDSHFHYPTEI